VTARVHQRIEFDTDKTAIDAKAWSSPSYHRICPAYEKTGVPENEIGKLGVWEQEGRKSFAFQAHYAGPNPLTPPGTPPIDVFSSFSILDNRVGNSLVIKGTLTGDDFPSTEVFITDPSGQSVFLGIGFYEGSPYTSLWGENRNRYITHFSLEILTDANGDFTAVMQSGETYSIDVWNRFFTQADPHQGGP
jgi:hypothetical protein